MLTQHGLDTSRADIQVIKGICYIRGTITATNGWNIPDVEAEVLRMAVHLRSKAGIKNVIVELNFPGKR